MIKPITRTDLHRLLHIGSLLLLGMAVTSAMAIGITTRSAPAARAYISSITITLPEAERAQAAQMLKPMLFQPVTREDALTINAKVPVSTLPNAAASPFNLSKGDPLAYARALDCLTAAIYYEAGIEKIEGQRAVAQVVLNRMRHPAYPKTVCGVVFQGSERTTGCQFTFTCDGAMNRVPNPALWRRARAVAEEALGGAVEKPVGNATHYHTNWVTPYWSPSLIKVANIGTHIFYRWQGGLGLPPAFRGRHTGSEPDIAAMDRLGATVRLAVADVAQPKAGEGAPGDAPVMLAVASAPPLVAPAVATVRAEAEDGVLEATLVTPLAIEEKPVFPVQQRRRSRAPMASF